MRKDQNGSAMIIVMCVMVIATALCLSLLLTASVLVTNANRTNNKEQCRISAVSVSEVLEAEITSFVYKNPDGSDVLPASDANDGTLKGKLLTIPSISWYSYDPNAGTLAQLAKEGKDRFSYTLATEGLPGTTSVVLYWVDETGEDLKSLDPENLTDAREKFMNVTLYVEVTSTMDEESCTIISLFQPYFEGDSWSSWKWSYLGHTWERGDS